MVLTRRALAWALGLAAVGFAALAFLRTLDSAGAGAAPPWPVLVGALAVGVASQLLGAWGWMALVQGRGDPKLLRGAFHASQLAKYVPIGLAQAAGQIALARRAGMGGADAAFAWVVLGVATGTAGLALAAALAFLDNGLPATVQVVVLAGPASLLALHPRVLAGLHRVLSRWWPRLAAAVTVPDLAGLVRCSASRVAWTALQGALFAGILRSLAPVPTPTALAAFALAFALGLAVVPVPSGVAIREVVLVVALSPFAPGVVVVTAAVWHRLVVIASELVVVLGVARSQVRTPPAPPAT